MTENGKKIILEATNDSKIKKALEGVTTKEEAVKILNEKGYKCTLEDFDVDMSHFENAKVSLDEARAISGGATCVCVIIGAGGDSDGGCGCLGAGAGFTLISSDKRGLCGCEMGGGGKW